MASDPPPAEPATLTYKDAGVDIDAGNQAVARIARLVGRARRPEQRDGIGGFAGMFAMPEGLRDPLLVSCTDGVGTKLAVAQAMGRHDTVGIDLVAMCVNDLIVTGAEPLFLLDYVACGRVDPSTIEAIVAGIVEGCVQAGCALLGGETAEHPGTMEPDHYDLAAFAVGVVERAQVLGPDRVRAGDRILGLRASGLHSNGYSLARKALLAPEHGGLTLDAPLPGAGTTVGEALLVPTRIYVRALAALTDLPGTPLHAAAHITGGGLVENPPRALPATLAARIDLSRVPRPPILDLIARCGVSEAELHRTFNCGLGMLLYVAPESEDACLAALRAAGEDPLVVGEIIPRAGEAVVLHESRP